MSIIKRKAGSEDIVKSVLEFDSVPTEGSPNLVESGAVAKAIGNIGKPLVWKGPATVAELNAGITGIQPGWTYTLTDAGTLTDGSVDVEIGDEVAWVADGKWFKVCTNVVSFVTPDIFGAKGDGTTDDTEAFEAMIASSNSYIIPGKTYVVGELTIDKNFKMLGLSGSLLKAKESTQTSILNITAAGPFYISGVSFNGLGSGSASSSDRGGVNGILLGANSTSRIFLSNLTLSQCKRGIFAPKTLWNSRFENCRFNLCGIGTCIGDSSASSSGITYLELSFKECYWNQCDIQMFLYFGTQISFENCSFGNESVTQGGKFFHSIYGIQNVSFRNCNFEGVYITDAKGAITAESVAINVHFDDCIFHVLKKVDGATKASLFNLYGSEGGITLSNCRFEEVSIESIVRMSTGSTKTFSCDWLTLSRISTAFGKVRADNVFSNNTHIFTVIDIPNLSALPDSTPWSTNLYPYFKGTIIRINKTNDFYEWDGSSWVKLVHVPAPTDATNNYTLKSVAGVLSWVQDT